MQDNIQVNGTILRYAGEHFFTVANIGLVIPFRSVKGTKDSVFL